MSSARNARTSKRLLKTFGRTREQQTKSRKNVDQCHPDCGDESVDDGSLNQNKIKSTDTRNSSKDEKEQSSSSSSPRTN